MGNGVEPGNDTPGGSGGSAKNTLGSWCRWTAAWKNVYVREPSSKEILNGIAPKTHFGQMCEHLGIEIIAASSPQAKGRVERNHGTHQDRLVKPAKSVAAVCSPHRPRADHPWRKPILGTRFTPAAGVGPRLAEDSVGAPLSAPPSAPQGYAPAESSAANQNIKKGDISSNEV